MNNIILYYYKITDSLDKNYYLDNYNYDYILKYKFDYYDLIPLFVFGLLISICFCNIYNYKKPHQYIAINSCLIDKNNYKNENENENENNNIV